MPGREVFGEEELQAVLEVMKRKVLFRYGFDKEREGIFKVAEFEKAFAAAMGCRYALAVASGSAAVKIALKALNLLENGEVLVPAFTFVASVEAVQEAGLKPVLCEVDDSLNLSVADVESKVTGRTVALLPVHMCGSACDMDSLMSLAREKGLKVVEDNCQSTGASYKGRKLGTIGDAGAFSFDYVKVMTTGEGGMVTTNEERIYKEAEFYHDHGHPHLPGVGRGLEERRRNGFNYRMSELQGALGLVQLKKLDEVISRQRHNKKIIKEGLKDVPGLSFRFHHDPAGEIATFLVFFLPDSQKVEKFKAIMVEKGVTPGVLSYWHFTANVAACGGYFPRTEALLKRMVVLEIQALMSQERLEQIIDAVWQAARIL